MILLIRLASVHLSIYHLSGMRGRSVVRLSQPDRRSRRHGWMDGCLGMEPIIHSFIHLRCHHHDHQSINPTGGTECAWGRAFPSSAVKREPPLLFYMTEKWMDLDCCSSSYVVRTHTAKKHSFITYINSAYFHHP